ncbi:hypothetical protein RJT34_06810 [Clitoria ternatea]|uniref:ZF-HD dimerization-type domain-containing protein n=1 Tax=Clitoria ternatea TaxID=43366 RepID=A0AAN9K444_CLITE
MELTPSTATTHTIDIDTQTPPQQTQPTTNKDSKSSSFTNGSLKRHTTTVPPPSTVVSYKECLKNHAASIGGHALDGCGEFMPSLSSNPTEPRSLTCAACGCHRNFHRRGTQEFPNPNFISFYHSPPPPPPPPHHGLSLSTSPSPSSGPSPRSSPSPPPISHHFPPSYHHHYQSSAPNNMLLALGNEHRQRSFNFSYSSKTENPSGNKKRHRTKFSEEQKEKMHRFSEKLGWRMQKGEEGLVEEFCNGIGVSKGVFKVWMHNNKKRSSESGGDSYNNNNHHHHDNPYNTNSTNHDIHRE